MKPRSLVICLVALLVVFEAVDCVAQEPTSTEPSASKNTTDSQKKPQPDPKPYDQVITSDAKSQAGVFTLHTIKDKFYCEIPKSALGKEFLLTIRVAQKSLPMDYDPDAANLVVRWELHGNRVLLRSVSYDLFADDSLPIARAVRSANDDTILMAFPIEAWAKGEAPVVEVSRLFATDVPEVSGLQIRRQLGKVKLGKFDGARSFVERAAAYPANVEVEATLTYGANPDTASPTMTMRMHYSMVELPEKTMRARLADERVGFFSVSQDDVGRDEQRSSKRKYIARWRLEKKDPSAALSDPIKPIVYYIDPATPLQWRPWIKRGIEAWQPAFEEAGFKNAILARDAPTPEEDPNWSPEDARYSVVRWTLYTGGSANGPRISDPRSGEIVNADIQLDDNITNRLREWYFVQAGPLDRRAQRLPFPDELMGRLLQWVVTHEVGHTLGLAHNMKASSLYPAAKIRDKEWLAKMRHVPTIMDYCRFNYVAQPEDQIPPEDLIAQVGPYDKWAIRWGYTPMPAADSPDAEKPTLDHWAREQDATPWLRFSTSDTRGSDPGENTEAVGDADAVYSTGMGMKNLRRVMDMIVAATSRPGEPFDGDLKEMYSGRVGVLTQWTLEMGHVVSIVGGVDSQEKYPGQGGVLFTPVPQERQRAAVRFLNENAFETRQVLFLVPADVLRRIEPMGALDHVRDIQKAILTKLLDNNRLARLIEQEALDPANAYRPVEFLSDLQHGVWRELAGTHITIDAYRRNLQRSYVALLAGKATPAGATASDDVRPYVRAELRALRAQATRALPRAADASTRAHLEDVRDQIVRALDPTFPLVVPTQEAVSGGAHALE